MGWNRRYAIVSYLRSSLWTVPLFALVVEQIGVRFLTFIDQPLQWVPALTVTAAEAGDALATIQSLTIAFLVFMFGSMLVALQVASAQLTPRIIATLLLRDNTIRFTVGLFVFTLLLAVGTKARLQDPLPLAMVTVAMFAASAGIIEAAPAIGVRGTASPSPDGVAWLGQTPSPAGWPRVWSGQWLAAHWVRGWSGRRSDRRSAPSVFELSGCADCPLPPTHPIEVRD